MAIKVMAKPELKLYRIKRGYSQENLAKMLGYTTSAYGKIENRKNGTRSKGIDGICKVLNVEFDQVFEFSED